jgi:hypothetical protein
MLLRIVFTILSVMSVVIAGCGKDSRTEQSKATALSAPGVTHKDDWRSEDITIDERTIAAYEKLGAEYGVFFDSEFGAFTFVPGVDWEPKGLRGFYFGNLQEGKFPKLPRVDVTFALYLGGSGVRDTQLKELKGYNNLKAIYLGNTQVTDLGLKELKNLQNLTILYLGHSKVTVAGLKELKDFKNLTTLGLPSTRVTDDVLKELNSTVSTRSSFVRYYRITS